MSYEMYWGLIITGIIAGTLVCPSGGGARPGCRWPDYKRRFDI